MSQCLMTQKKVLIIDIGGLRSKDISHREIETYRESSFRGRNPMEASTLRFGEIRCIIAAIVATMQKM